jgi:hypothetical protein
LKQKYVLDVVNCLAGCWWLTPVILATQEAEIRRIVVLGKQFWRPYLEKTHHKKGLVKWVKV